jgi:hypothetical protein
MEIINNQKCQASHEGIHCTGCICNSYGGYCKKHKDLYLLNNNSIILNRFTNDIKDYKLKDLKSFYISHIKQKHTKFKKQDYFNCISKVYEKNQSYQKDISKIIKIQSFIRMKTIKNNIYYQGISYYNRNLCNNDEDFYSYEPKEDIESKYYFSYKDSSNNYWCFDIRSLKKLLDMNYSNPYTTEEIPQQVKQRIHEFIKLLRKRNIQVSIDTTVITDRKTQVKQKWVDLFAQIEYSGYSCDVEWLLNLNAIRIKKLYRELEDIWNYRAQLSNEVKRRIVPPDGRMFVMPVSDYMHCSSLLELQEILVNELSKILHATSQSDMNLGFMYFIIGLSVVSRPCFLVHHEWVQLTFG